MSVEHQTTNNARAVVAHPASANLDLLNAEETIDSTSSAGQRTNHGAHPHTRQLRQSVLQQRQHQQGNSAVERSIARAFSVQRADVEAPQSAPAQLYNLTIGDQVLEHASHAQAIQALRQHHTRLRIRLEGDEEGHTYLYNLHEDQWIVGFFADTLGGVDMPSLLMWTEPRVLLTMARGALDAGDLEGSLAHLQQAERAYQECHNRFVEYRDGTISGAEHSIKVLKVTAVVGAVAASVATGGIAAGGAAPMLSIAGGTGMGLLGSSTLAGVSAGAYGMTQDFAGQASERANDLRQSFDVGAILRRGASDAVSGFVGAFVGGKLSGYITRSFGSYISNLSDDALMELGKQMGMNGPLPRDFLVTQGQRAVASFLGDMGASPLTVAVGAVVKRVTGGEAMPGPEEFADQVFREMVQNGAMHLFLAAVAHGRVGTIPGDSSSLPATSDAATHSTNAAPTSHSSEPAAGVTSTNSDSILPVAAPVALPVAANTSISGPAPARPVNPPPDQTHTQPGSEGAQAASKRLSELSSDPQTGAPNPKSVSEAHSILQAEREGLVENARRPDLEKGEPNLDFIVDGGYVELKTPVDPAKRALSLQAGDMTPKINTYDGDVLVIIDLKNLSSAQKAGFKQELAKKGADMSRIGFLNDT